MSTPTLPGTTSHDGDMTEMLQELRILLQGSQLMTGFLIVIPYSAGFAQVDQTEKWVFLATFICSLTSLILFTGPAAQHRIERPLRDRDHFKRFANRMALFGMAALSLALVLATQLVVAAIMGRYASMIVAGAVLLLVLGVWWVLPIWRKPRDTSITR